MFSKNYSLVNVSELATDPEGWGWGASARNGPLSTQAPHPCPSGAFQPAGVFVMWGFEQADHFAPADQARSRPHHSATKSAMEPVMRLTEARLTRSSKAWMFSVIGP